MINKTDIIETSTNVSHDGGHLHYISYTDTVYYLFVDFKGKYIWI